MDQNQAREIVHCYECENEWYRDRHGLICPECQSDFVEILERNQNQRHEQQFGGGHAEDDGTGGGYQHEEFYAPDPDEADVDNIQWSNSGPGQYHFEGTANRSFNLNPNAQHGGQPQMGATGGVMGLLGGILQNIMQPPQPQGGQHFHPDMQPRSASAPGSPGAWQNTPGGMTYTRQDNGDGFSVTFTSRTHSNFGGTPFNLTPRNAGAPQNFQPQPENIDAMLQQMLMNIGTVPMGMFQGHGGMHHSVYGGPAGEPQDRGVPIEFDIQPGPGGPILGLFNLFAPPGGRFGDAVYSQEALDRVITQLMEQHQAGHAPGPASEAAIRSLPTREIAPKDLSDEGKAECSICMEEVSVGTTVTMLPCTHWFHADCVNIWLREHDTCPHCRQGIMPKDGDQTARSPNQEPRHDMNSPEYTRTSIQGGFPFTTQSSTGNSPSISRQSTQTDTQASTSQRRTSGGRSSIFSTMREAFGRSSSNNGEGGRGSRDAEGGRR